MLSLLLDSSNSALAVGLAEDGKLVDEIQYEANQRQSEVMVDEIAKLFDKHNVTKKDLSGVVVTKGPGSYTGVRIAMSIAKTIGEVKPCDVYTISTLRLYAACQENVLVLMDARAGRAYYGIYNKDEIIKDDDVKPLEEIETLGYTIVGDGSLLDFNDDFGNIPDAFLKTKHLWKKADNIAYLTPKYLKESESYYR